MTTTLLLLALGDTTVKVYILAGQSNMEGKGSLKLAEVQSSAPEFKDDYKHLKPDGKWIVRDDVFINFLERRGPLTVGFGSPNCVGPELEFGLKVGDAHTEPVLLIKAAWGGRSLGRDFLPPSAKQPTDAELREMVAKENANPKKKADVTVDDVRARYGKAYREMLAEVRTNLAEMGTRFPALKGRTPELAGFVWFQGWNDHINAAFADAYEANLLCLIQDLRKDLNAPKLPVVIGQMGQSGTKPATGGMKKVNDAMAAAGEKLDRVKVVATAPLWDLEADKVYPTWRENKAEWDKVGSDHGYHYYGSARFFLRAGRAFGESMLSFK